jgi:uncharacterized protein Yka (UPF0111/DUF47 family)
MALVTVSNKSRAGLAPQILVQAERIAAGLEVFEEMVQAPAAAKGARISDIKKRADAAAAKLLQRIEQGEGPILERRRMRRCSRALEELLFCVKSAAEDILVFQAPEDENLLQMAKALKEAGERIAAAIQALPMDPQACGKHLVAAKRAEQRLQTIFRRSLSELVKGPNIVTILKSRELYRRLSDAGLHGAEAAEILGELLAATL